MTGPELQELLADCPQLYHVAEPGAWASIRDEGLLSATALLDRHDISEPLRSRFESTRRTTGMTIETGGVNRAVLRDQSPMSDRSLARCLPQHLAPRDWYRLLNGKVFFWLSLTRVYSLTSARANRGRVLDVLEVDARALIAAHAHRVSLCPINSGASLRFGQPRDERIFSRIVDYPYALWRARRRRGERAVELTVDYAVPDIARHTRRILGIAGTETVWTLAPDAR